MRRDFHFMKIAPLLAFSKFVNICNTKKSFKVNFSAEKNFITI